ncbi:MAG: serine/threonine-protein kinase [Planctomyces sp.]|jgi:serine/threonine protein kinase
MPDPDQSIIQQIVTELRAFWVTCPAPDLRMFLEQQPLVFSVNPSLNNELLVQLLETDLELRAHANMLRTEMPAVDEYQKWFPLLPSLQIRKLEKLELGWRQSPGTVIVSASEARREAAPTPSATAPEFPGYTDVSLIGRGSLGVVFQATQLGTNRVVAIKCIRPEMESEEKARTMFVREASVAIGLKHPRIVDCLTFGFAGLRPYLVMEYVPSENLEALVWEHSPGRRIRLAVKVTLKLLEAIGYAHSCGIVHRDIKPSNILASIVRGRLQLKVSDFGLAKLHETAGYSGVTETGEVCGTIAYMSPEQLLDSRGARPESDVYSALVCLYRLLTMEFPHPVGSPAEILASRRYDRILDPRQFNSEIPDDLKSLLDCGLSPNPKERFLSAASLIECLRQLPILRS